MLKIGDRIRCKLWHSESEHGYITEMEKCHDPLMPGYLVKVKWDNPEHAKSFCLSGWINDFLVMSVLE